LLSVRSRATDTSFEQLSFAFGHLFSYWQVAEMAAGKCHLAKYSIETFGLDYEPLETHCFSGVN